MFIFARNLQKLRKRAKLTQQQLAEKLGVTRSRIGAWEEGRSSPNPEQLAGICEVFGVWNLEEILKRAEVQKKS